VSLSENASLIRIELLLQYIVQFFGVDVLKEEYIIQRIINDLFRHDIALRNNLLICVKCGLPDMILEIMEDPLREILVKKIIFYLRGQIPFDKSESKNLVSIWQFALGWENVIKLKYDPLFEVAARYVFMVKEFSIQMIQRHFSIGYNRAACITDQLGIVGIVEPFCGNGFRKVIVKDLEVLGEILKNILMF
jgi:DNA segregation ATPase FtsK/SpoIIIE-like protein